MSIPEDIKISKTIEVNSQEAKLTVCVTFPVATDLMQLMELQQILADEIRWFFLVKGDEP